MPELEPWTWSIPRPPHRHVAASLRAGSLPGTTEPDLVEGAFAAEDLRIDFVGYTSETLHGAIVEPLDTMRTGRLTPKTIAIRILVSDMAKPLALPVATSGDDDESAQ